MALELGLGFYFVAILQLLPVANLVMAETLRKGPARVCKIQGSAHVTTICQQEHTAKNMMILILRFIWLHQRMYSTFKALMCTTVQPTVSILDEGVLAKLSNSGPASIAHSRADAIPIPVFGRKK